jgi:hypothetical protein
MGKAEFKRHCYELRQLEEMCMDTDELQQYYDEHYLTEALEDNSQSFRKQMSSALSRTKKTTGGLVRAYDTITTAKGNSMYSAFQLLNKMIHGIVRVIAFVWNCMAKIPDAITKTLDIIVNIPKNILTKLRGDIQLYITSSDIETLYRVSFVDKAKDFLADAKNFTKGDYWKKGFLKGDEARARKLNAEYLELKNITFNKSTIRMQDKNAIDTYFTNGKVVSYRDLKGHALKGSYLEALGQLNNDLSVLKGSLQEIEHDLTEKDWRSLNDSSYTELSVEARAMINEGMNSVAKVVGLIGNIMSYVMKDIDTINNAAKKLAKAAEKQK